MKLIGEAGYPVLGSARPEIFANWFARDGVDAAYLRVVARMRTCAAADLMVDEECPVGDVVDLIAFEAARIVE